MSLWQAEWRYLLSGGMPAQELSNPAVSWLSERAWQDILGLSALDKFSNLAESFTEHLQGFKRIFDSNHPHRHINRGTFFSFMCTVLELSITDVHFFAFAYRQALPGKWDTKLDSFQKLLVLRCLRADCLVQGLQDFVSSQLGQRFIEPQVESLPSVWTVALMLMMLTCML